MKAEWIKYFNFSTEQSYDRPCCPVCSELYEPTPIVYEHGHYVCLNCHQEAELDKKQKKWIDDMRRTKKSVDKCFVCGAYKFVTTRRRDPITRKWKTCSGRCSNCGCTIRV